MKLFRTNLVSQEVIPVVAAKIQCGSGEDVWLGVSLEHIRRDIEGHAGGALETLREIPISEVTGMEDYVHAVEVLRRIERQYRGQAIPFIAGTSAYFLGRLPQHVSQPA